MRKTSGRAALSLLLLSCLGLSSPRNAFAGECPAAGNIGIHNASQWYDTIRMNLGRTIEICSDLEFRPGDIREISDGFSGSGQFEYMWGFRGRIEGHGHTLRPVVSASPETQSGISLGLQYLLGGTIENLVLEVPEPGVANTLRPPYVVAATANDATVRNITLRNVTAGAGLVAEASNSSFDGISGDLELRVSRAQNSAGGVAGQCRNCDLRNLDLTVNLNADAQRSANGNFPSVPSLTYVGGLIGISYNGFVNVSDSIVRGSLPIGYDKGMLIGALNGGDYPAGKDTPPAQLMIDNVRVLGADLSQVAGVYSYTAGGFVGRASLPTTITRSLVKDTIIQASQQAGGLLGGAGPNVQVMETAAENVRLRANGVVGGLIAFSSGGNTVEDSYFRGEAIQSQGEILPGLTIKAAGGILGFNAPDNFLRRVYVKAAVRADNAADAGALIGGDESMGFSGGVAEHAYYDSSLANQAHDLGTPLTPAQMLMPASFVGFDPQVWQLRNGALPRLRNNPVLTVQDLFDFLALFFTGDLRADLNMSGSVSVEDLFLFLATYFNS